MDIAAKVNTMAATTPSMMIHVRRPNLRGRGSGGRTPRTVGVTAPNSSTVNFSRKLKSMFKGACRWLSASPSGRKVSIPCNSGSA